MRRALIATTGALLGGLAASAFLVVAVSLEIGRLDPATATDLIRTLTLALAMAGADPTDLKLAAGLHILWLALVLMTFGPVGLAAMIGEMLGRRTLPMFTVVAGIAAAALPALAVPALSTREAPGRLLPILFLTGVSGGLIHWLVAGQRRAIV